MMPACRVATSCGVESEASKTTVEQKKLKVHVFVATNGQSKWKSVRSKGKKSCVKLSFKQTKSVTNQRCPMTSGARRRAEHMFSYIHICANLTTGIHTQSQSKVNVTLRNVMGNTQVCMYVYVPVRVFVSYAGLLAGLLSMKTNQAIDHNIWHATHTNLLFTLTYGHFSEGGHRNGNQCTVMDKKSRMIRGKNLCAYKRVKV